MARYLIPRPVGEHASKEGVHVASIHGLAVLLDAVCISKDQALPEQRIAFSELICDLPVGGKTLRYKTKDKDKSKRETKMKRNSKSKNNNKTK